MCTRSSSAGRSPASRLFLSKRSSQKHALGLDPGVAFLILRESSAKTGRQNEEQASDPWYKGLE
jgi:hypothetical protein